ncbi:MAG TPA: hypothetical protein VMZ33_04425 [Candidatus Limnocylindrales bacterium]|nr:hypothetical protein [Candidatus Limnocylindrales bacterium]
MTLLGLMLPAAVSAHPLGNFTINRYNGLTVAPTWTHLDRVVDMAELPTVQARQEMDINRDGAVADEEAAAWATSACAAAPSSLTFSIGSKAAELLPAGVGLTFAPGQAGLQTLRLACTYVSEYSAIASAETLTFDDASYPNRVGWREIVIAGSATETGGAEAFAAGSSDRLHTYPADASGATRAQTSARFSVKPIDGATAAQPIVDEAVPLGSPADAIVHTSTQTAAVPGGVSDLPAELGAILQAGDLSLPAMVLAFLVAGLVGAFHAVTPGHGKTLMAAYLVGTRGTSRHALALGLTVTVSHTIGVLALGAIVLVADAALPSERLLPILGLASGILVTLLGSVFLFQRVRTALHEREHVREQEREHARQHAQGHDHAHDHAHAHDRGQGQEDAGWHSHGLVRHTHLPSTDGPLRTRNLIALGLVGGLVPSASAILILVGSIAAGRPALGMALTVAFGAGMALVLVGVGVMLVRARSLVERIPSARLGRALAYAPIVTAITFLVVGVAITVQAGGQLR